MTDSGRDAQALVERAFGMDSKGADGQRGWDELRAFLVARIRKVIDRNFAQLPQLLYQVDVPEARVNQVFETAASADQIPEMLADLVLERAKEIAAARADYARRHGDGDGA